MKSSGQDAVGLGNRVKEEVLYRTLIIPCLVAVTWIDQHKRLYGRVKSDRRPSQFNTVCRSFYYGDLQIASTYEE